jgi:hypothetical protein
MREAVARLRGPRRGLRYGNDHYRSGRAFAVDPACREGTRRPRGLTAQGGQARGHQAIGEMRVFMPSL